MRQYLSVLLLLFLVSPIAAQTLSVRQQKDIVKQHKRDSIRATKRIWLSILGGPSYTPEASLGVGGAILASFKLNKNDTISQRSFIPAGFNISINGTFVVAGTGAFFFNENRFKIFTSYSYRNEPSNYFGKGYGQIENTPRSVTTTLFHKSSVLFNPRFLWQVVPKFYLGVLTEVSYQNLTKFNELMEQDSYVNSFARKYVNLGLGAIVQYDTRDDVATPNSGMLVSGTAKFMGRYLGGKYNYQLFDIEYRQFKQLFNRRSTLAWTARSQITTGDVPFTELPMFGSPFDLRGYYWGKYRDNSMAYAIVEYRHMFGSEEAYNRGSFWSKLGAVAWGGTGSIGENPASWTRWKFNYGAGLRIQIQPRKNFRFDVGKAPGEKGVLLYMNMTEAF